ncbi:hypothetical protein niasHT_000590 [Heterodera trifolii]|uniref:Uncharacterized protein n=1 Tax=Heterodera trifolii TaxID=157864 RepID=A0ABD2LYY4_9BILA
MSRFLKRCVYLSEESVEHTESILGSQFKKSFLRTKNNRSQILFLKPNCFYCETSNQHNSSFLKRCIVVVVEESTKGMFRRVSFSTDGELLGLKVEMTWFRDIRRYLAHCAKQGIRPSRFRGRSEYRRDDEQYKGRGRSRSPTRSPEREEGARSRSASAASRHSNANRRRSQSRSHSARSHSRSLSSGGEVRAARDGNASHSEREKSLDYSDIEEKKVRLSPPRVLSPSPPPLKKSKKEKRKKEKRQRRSKHMSPSLADHRQPHSDMEMGGEEEDGLSNGGVRKMLKMESSSPVNNSKACGQLGENEPNRGMDGDYTLAFLDDFHWSSQANSPTVANRTTKAAQGGAAQPVHHVGPFRFSNIRFATPPPQPPPVLRNVPLPPVTTNNNEMMVDRTCRNNPAKPSASDFGLAG